jgi:hypothetical protein
VVLAGADRSVDLRVQKRHLGQVSGRHGQDPGQVLPDPTRRVSDRCDVADGLATMIVNQNPTRCGVGRDADTLRPVDSARAHIGRPRIVIAGRVYDGDSVITQALGLVEEESLGLEGEAITVEEVAGDQNGVYVFTDRDVDGVAEGFAGRFAQPDANVLGSAGEGGVEVYVGHVQESHGPS